MNNDKSNTRGTRSSRAVVILLLVGFSVAIFASPAAARGWDPNNWPWAHREQIVIRPEYDDSGWGDPHLSPVDVWQILKYSIYSPSLYWLYEFLPDVDRGDDGVTNPNDQNNDPNVRPIRTTSSD